MQETDMNDRLGAEAERTGHSTAANAAQQSATRAVEENIHNPKFLDEVADPDVDSAVYDWLEAELGPVLSQAHILGNRSEGFEHQQAWLNRNRAKREIVRSSPGRLLKDDPELLRQAQGVDSKAEIREPMRPDEKEATYDAMAVATERQSLSVDGAGIEALTTATAEQRVVRNRDEAETKSGVKSRVKGFFD